MIVRDVGEIARSLSRVVIAGGITAISLRKIFEKALRRI